MSQIITYRLLVLAYITAQRQLIHEKMASRSEWNTKYNFIVVGAGSAGSAVAMRLSEDKTINVLLLEAGGPQSAVYNDIPGMYSYISEAGINIWNYYNEPQTKVGFQFPGKRMPEFRSKTLGGTSTHNTMVYNRGNRRDFDNWVETYGAKGWSYAEVLPYFMKFENNTDLRIVRQNPEYHSTSGPVMISTPSDIPNIFSLLNKSYNELGLRETDINGDNQTGYMNAQAFIAIDGFRAGAGNAYVDPNPHPENLHIVCKALVVKILFNGLTAIGVEFIKNSKSYKVFADKEVVISAGPINSPQLLMLSGIGPKDHLDKFNIGIINNLPVGDNVANHPVVYISTEYKPNLSLPVPQPTVEQLTQLYFSRKGLLSQLPQNLLYFSTKSNSNKNWPNIMANFDVINLTLGLLRVRSKGTIRLQSSNPLVPPLINSNFFGDSQDFEDIITAISYMFFILKTTSISQYLSIPSFASIGCNDCPNRHSYECREGIECLIKQSTISSNHISGSCRMGSIERSDVVVDPYLRVKNVRNLRVCDSSIFPELPNANTNAASIMVGEKCAQIIKDCYHLN